MPITSIISLNQLINWFQLFQQNHYFLKDFGFGEPYDIGTSRQMTFPYMWVTMNEDSSIATGSNNKSAIPDISFSIMFMDKINIQENYLDTNGFPSDNSQEILSDTLQCLQDLITMIQQNWGQYGVLISQDVSFYPAVDETQDKSTGVVGRFVLRTRQVNCIIPENPYWLPPTPTPTPVEFVAITNTDISYSYEGQDWYVGNNTTGDSLRSRSLVYNGSRWLAGTSFGSLIIYSDDSINWSGTNASSVFDVFVNSIIWNGSKWFAGGRSSNVFAESTDGINWTALTDASTYFSRIFQLVYDGTNIVAAGWDLSNTPQVASTNDGGNTWTDIVTPFGPGLATSLTYSSDLGLYVYTQQSGFDNVYISNDRVNWSAVTNTDVSAIAAYSCGWDGTKFVLGNQYNTNPLFYSYDGIDWSASTNGGDYFYIINDLHWDGNNWYAVGAGGDPGEARMAYSTDGISWTGITNFPSFATNFTSILSKNSPELIPPIP